MPSILFFFLANFGDLNYVLVTCNSSSAIFENIKWWQKNYINYSTPKWFTCLLLSLLTLSTLLFLLIYWTSSDHKVLHLSLSWQEIHHQRSWRYSGSISLLYLTTLNEQVTISLFWCIFEFYAFLVFSLLSCHSSLS